MKTLSMFLATFIFWACTTTTAVAGSVTEFYFFGDANSIAGIVPHDLTPQQGYTFSVQTVVNNGIDLSITDFPIDQWWYVDFAAPNGHVLTTGDYEGATRDVFLVQPTPGLSFEGDGEGDNQLSGYFKVLQISYDPSDNITSFAADFVQYDENFSNRFNYGSIRYNSDIPINTNPTPEPASIVLMGIGLVVAGCLRPRR